MYGGQRVRFGNNVGDKIEVKTRRNWKLNILTRKLFSKSLNRVVQVRVSTRVLRTIDKLGGLDEYLLGEKESRIKELGESGWWLRWAIMQTPDIKARFAAERRRIGLPNEVVQQLEAEVAEAQAVLEETSDLDQAEAATEIGEAVGTDGVFVVEQPPGLPSLKFRVGPNKHLVLTADGWRRTRPATNHAVETRKSKLRERIEDELLPRRERAFRADLARQQADLAAEERMSAEEMNDAVKAARREWRSECAEEAESRYAQHVAKRDARKTMRDAVKKAEEAAEKERKKTFELAE